MDKVARAKGSPRILLSEIRCFLPAPTPYARECSIFTSDGEYREPCPGIRNRGADLTVATGTVVDLVKSTGIRDEDGNRVEMADNVTMCGSVRQCGDRVGGNEDARRGDEGGFDQIRDAHARIKGRGGVLLEGKGGLTRDQDPAQPQMKENRVMGANCCKEREKERRKRLRLNERQRTEQREKTIRNEVKGLSDAR